MTDKELRSLNRAELLEILIQVLKENEKLKMEIDGLNDRLNSRRIEIENAGSIAEAALKLNGVFEAADEAAKQYIYNMEQCEAHCQTIEREAQEDADSIKASARAEAEKLIDDAKQNAQTITETAKCEAENYWNDTKKKLDEFLSGYNGLRELLF